MIKNDQSSLKSGMAELRDTHGFRMVGDITRRDHVERAFGVGLEYAYPEFEV